MRERLSTYAYGAVDISLRSPWLAPTFCRMQARDVRHAVGMMYDPKDPEGSGWKQARKRGWRVIRVCISEAGRGGADRYLGPFKGQPAVYLLKGPAQ